MANIITDIDFFLDDHAPDAIAKGIAQRMKQRRLELQMTQQGLADKSGISLGSLKRFESTAEISLKHLLMLAVVLDDTDEFASLFTTTKYKSIEEVIQISAAKKRMRGKRNG